ncbi:MAG: hypothetical protein QOG87_580 [Actinomycetota bacterium]
MVAAATAALLVLSAVVLVTRSADDEPSEAVLGRQVERASTTTTTTIAVDESTTSVPVTTPILIVETTTTSTLGGTTSTTVAGRTTTTGQPSGRTVETADTTSTFDYRPDGGGGMTTSDSAPPRDPFKFAALGSDVDHDGVAELRSEMANQTNREIGFPEGLVLRFIIKRDGQQWRTVELRFPDTQSLAAGGSLEIESATPLQQQYGRYDVTGEVTIEYR